jgi:hypothetical protein
MRRSARSWHVPDQAPNYRPNDTRRSTNREHYPSFSNPIDLFVHGLVLPEVHADAIEEFRFRECSFDFVEHGTREGLFGDGRWNRRDVEEFGRVATGASSFRSTIGSIDFVANANLRLKVDQYQRMIGAITTCYRFVEWP